MFILMLWGLLIPRKIRVSLSRSLPPKKVDVSDKVARTLGFFPDT